MTQTTSRWRIPRKRGLAAAVVAAMGIVGAVTLIASGLTNAAYNDRAIANGVLGNPHEFRIETQESSGNWKTSAPASQPALVASLPNDGAIGVLSPLEATLYVRIAEGGPTGTIVPSLTPTQACLDQIAALDSGPDAATWRTTTPTLDCQRVFDNLLFSVTWNGKVVALSASAAQFNQTNSRRLAGAVSGVAYQLDIVATVAPTLPFKYNAATTGVGLSFVGTTDSPS